MALNDVTEDPRLQKARNRRQKRMLFTPTPEEEAGRRLNNIPQNPALDVGHLLTQGITFGLSPTYKGVAAGVGAAIHGQPFGPAYHAAKDEEAAGLATLHENAPKTAFGLEMLGGAAVPLGGGEAIAGRVATRFGTSAAKAVGAEAARVAAPEVAAQVGRQATLRALPKGARAVARAIGGAGAMAPVGATVGAVGTEGGLKERAIGAGKTAAAWMAGGAVLEPVVGAGGDVYRSVQAGRAATKAAREAPIWKNMPSGPEVLDQPDVLAQRQADDLVRQMETEDAASVARHAPRVAEQDARYAARTAPRAEIPPPERPPVVDPSDPMSARFRGLRRADELAPSPRPQGPSMIVPARPEPVARPVETPEERVGRLTGPAAPPEPSGLILPPPRRPLAPRAPAVEEAARGGREAVEARRIAREAGEVAAPPPAFSVTPRDFPPPRPVPAGRVGQEPPIGEGAERFARRELGQEAVPFRDIVPTPERPAPPTPTAVDIPPPARPAKKVVASSTQPEDLDELARFAHTSRIAGQGDPVDELLAATRIKRLSPADRATVRTKIKALEANHDPLTGMQREAPAAADPMAGLSPKVRERLAPVMEAKSEADLVAAATELMTVRMSESEQVAVKKLLEERRANLPRRVEAPAVEAPPAKKSPAYNPANEVKPKTAPLSTPEQRAAAEAQRQQRLAAERGETIDPEQAVIAYKTTLAAERKARGIVDASSTPDEIAAAADASPAVEEARAQTRSVADEVQERTKKLADEARGGAPEGAPKPPFPAKEVAPKKKGLTGKDFEGQVGEKNHMTRKEEGTIPTSAIKDLGGVKGEVPGAHRNRQGEKWEEFKADIKVNGIKQPITISVDRDGVPQIIEGNHRRDAAVELGLEEVPVDIRYFGHAQQQGGVLERATRKPPRAPLTGPTGHTTDIAFADGGKSPGRYRVVEAESLAPSHNPETWQRNPEYPEGVQGRQYHLDKTAQERFEGKLAKHDPTKPLDLTQEVGSGPATVTPDGIVVAGNERTMLLQRLAKERPEQFGNYRKLLEERAAQMGLDPAEIKAMKTPVLVRELSEAPADEAALRELNRRSDVPVGKEKDAVSEATSRAMRMKDAKDSVTHLADAETGINTAEGQTLRAYLTTSEGKKFVDQLVKDRVIEPSELPKFRDGKTGALTEQGIDMIERTLEAAAIGDPDVASLARANVPAVLNKLEHAIPSLVRSAEDETWSLSKRLQDALRLHIQAKDVPGGKLEDLLAQGSLLGEEHSPEAVALARFLDRSSKADVKLAAARYAAQAEASGRQLQSDDMFGHVPTSPQEAFKETFGDAGFATSVALRPIVGAGTGALIGGTQGDTADEKMKNAALMAALFAGVSLAPEISALLMKDSESELAPAAVRELRRITMKAADYIEKVGGDAGRFLADDIRQIDMRSTFRAGAQMDDAAKLFEGLTDEEIVMVKKVADSRKSAAGAQGKVKKAGEALRKILDRDKDDATRVGIKTSGKTGHAYPQVPTTEAVAALKALDKVGIHDPRVQKLAVALVDDGISKDMPEAIESLIALAGKREGSGTHRTPTVGMNPYLESSRFQLPESYVDWGNNNAFRSALRRNAATIEAARQWGPRHEATGAYLDGVSKHAGADVAADIQGFLTHDFGGVSRTNTAQGKIASAIGNYETASKLGNFLSPVLNYGQQFANLAHLPIEAQLKALKAYPPLIGRFMKEGLALREWAERSGVVYGHTAMADAPAGASGKITDALLTGFVKAAKSNEIRTAIASRYALEADIARVMKAAPKKAEGLSAFLQELSGGTYLDKAGKAAGPSIRRLEKGGIGASKLADIMQSGRRLTPGELHEAAYRLVHDTQFPMTVASKPIWWSRSPVARLAAKFKPFGMRQTQYIYENVLKEASRGNVAPMAKFVALATMTGEMYHVARDLVLGSDKSVTMHAAENEGELDGVGRRMLEDFAAQGGLGMIWDLQYGMSNWLGGPVVSTFNNIADAAPAVRQAASKGRYGQIPSTVLEFAKNEAPGVRQAASVYARVKASMTDSPFIAYSDLRADAARKSKADETAGDKVGATFDSMLKGQQEFETTINTIPYRSAATAIQAGDPQKAAKYLAIILRDTDNQSNTIGSARSTLSRRGPLGGLSAEQRKTYLAGLDPDERKEAVRLNLQWRRDSEAAIRAAVKLARSQE